jgi:hypothetical protein
LEQLAFSYPVLSSISDDKTSVIDDLSPALEVVEEEEKSLVPDFLLFDFKISLK